MYVYGRASPILYVLETQLFPLLKHNLYTCDFSAMTVVTTTAVKVDQMSLDHVRIHPMYLCPLMGTAIKDIDDICRYP